MSEKLPLSGTLGRRSAPFINRLLAQGKFIFMLEDACAVYGQGRSKTAKFISDLVKRGVVIRIKSGVYLIPQAGREHMQLSSWPIIARELLGNVYYFISHYSAMRLHGMTTHPSMKVYVTSSRRKRSKTIHNISYHFIYSKPEHLWGEMSYWVTKQEMVIVSDIERTLLDGFDRPEFCGGLKDVIRALWSKQSEINWKRLLEYAEKFRTKAAVKRLGFVLDMLAIGGDITSSLAELAIPSNNYILLDPSAKREGKYMKRWYIRVNANIDELKASVWE